MSRRVLAIFVTGLIALAAPLLAPLGVSTPRATTTAAGVTQHAAVASGYGQLPLAFEMNKGQAGASARVVAHGSGYTLALTPGAALLALRHPGAAGPADRFALPGQSALAPQPATPPTLLGMTWLGANPNPVVTGEQPLPGTVNYFLGNDPAQWHTNIPTFQQVRYHNVYPGVDQVYYGNQGQLEYDFVVAPGANPAAIQLGFTGASQLGVDLQGNLSLALPGGMQQQAKPLVYQTVSGARQPIAGGFTLAANQRIGFALGAYIPRLPLEIDPSYKFSTYLGGSQSDDGTAIAVDSAGSAYITGDTFSTDFPTASPEQSANAGNGDAFVTKFNPAGNALIYSTYLGGSNTDVAYAIALDTAGDAYVAGYTQSTNFPVDNAFQGTLGGAGATNAFVTKLTASGSALSYSTYLGGNNADYVAGELRP